MIATSLLWLALNIHNEARGEPFKCQVAVGEVVMRRVISMYYPNTVKGVVTEPYQFSWYHQGYKIDFSVLTLKDLSAAVSAMSGYYYTSTELHYTNNYVNNSWTSKMNKTFTCSNLTFYDSNGEP